LFGGQTAPPAGVLPEINIGLLSQKFAVTAARLIQFGDQTGQARSLWGSTRDVIVSTAKWARNWFTKWTEDGRRQAAMDGRLAWSASPTGTSPGWVEDDSVSPILQPGIGTPSLDDVVGHLLIQDKPLDALFYRQLFPLARWFVEGGRVPRVSFRRKG
jgi:hypothetical protein